MKLLQRSQGALLLARLSKSQADVAANLGASRALIGHWLTGERVPSPKFRRAMKRSYKIPEEAWDESAAKPKRPATKARDVATPASVAPAELPPEVAESNDPLVRVRALLLARDVDRLRKETFSDADATPLERAKVLASCGSTLTVIGKLTGETLEISEQRVLRLAAWRRIQDAIERVLAPWPDAMQAVGEELMRLGGEW